jgi:hypothetical protein
MTEKRATLRLEVTDVRNKPVRYAQVTEENFEAVDRAIEHLNHNPQLLRAMNLLQIVSVDDGRLILNDGQIRERVRVRR